MKALNSNKTGLAIFGTNGVMIDTNLPKWKTPLANGKDNNEKVRSALTQDLGNITFSLDQRTINNFTNTSLPFPETTPNIIIGHTKTYRKSDEEEKKGILSRLRVFFNPLKKDKPVVDEEPQEEYELDVLSLFSLMKSTSQENERRYVDRVTKYLKMIRDAESMGQVALAERLKENVVVNKYESILYSAGCYKIIPEETAVEFIKKSEKGVCIDYIKNFIRPIPAEVMEKKKAADDLMVFDNYVIMHYDPEGKSSSLTKEEKEKEEKKKKDPILFGVIAGSRNLYYITDWIDEKCNLTLSEFADTLEMKAEDFDIKEKVSVE